MVRTKLQRYDAIKNHHFVIDQSQELFFRLKSNWNKLFFKNDNPIILELACGKGEYTVGFAKMFPDKNFLGVDIKGERIFVGATQVEELGIQNAGFIRMNIHDLRNIFGDQEIQDIWLIHPDPRPKNSDRNRRITSPKFLNIYKKILKSGGTLRLKTDDIDLFHYSLEQFTQNNFSIKDVTFDLYNSHLKSHHFDIKTNYEKLFTKQGRKIHYVVCSL